ncbi:MAG: serine/threonine protein kinase [Myxococcales bacterium]|nr:serine/threonine protein kinase [Myxococcales bacterium]
MSDQANIAPVQAGDVLAGKYQVDRVLGVGGMGVVVAATHLQLKDKVALKFLLPQITQSESHVARFLREAQAAVKIKSAHVARVVDVGTLDADSPAPGSPYMVMEFLEGKDLSGVLEERGRLNWDEACHYVLQACEALAEAHSYGIVHRDLKPANMFLTKAPDGSPCVKVLDFGISKVIEGDQALTRTQTTVGSPVYMSPEQMRSARKVDARSDVWSMGVSLYELVVGEIPFIAETMVELCALVLENDAPLVRSMVPDAPEALEHIVAKCLKKNPADRYQTISELATDLADLLGTLEAQAQAGRIARIAAPAGEAGQREGTGKYDALRTRPMVAQNLHEKNGQRPTKDAIHTSPAVTLGQTGDAAVPATVQSQPRSKLPLIAGISLLALVGVGAIALSRGGNKPDKDPAAAAAPKPDKPVEKPVATASTSAQPVATMAATTPAPSASDSAAASASASAKKPPVVPTYKPTGTGKPNPADDPFGSRK